ncbi:MAG: outer membrane protein assembly factor BamA [Brevirhabdus sp.]
MQSVTNRLLGREQSAFNSFARISAIISFLFVVTFASGLSTPASAQSYRFSTVTIEGNVRVEDGTVLSYAAIPRGASVSAATLNAAYQRLLGSGLFETVELVPSGSRLLIVVQEYPTINRINIEGNRRLKDSDLMPLVTSAPRRVYSPSQAETDAATLTEAYRQNGRMAATVEPKIIRRSDNRVDLVFEVTEGRVVETERVSFVGNRNYSDRRLRRVLESKQAGLLRAIIRADTFVADRIEFDKQVLTDFYRNRGFVDFQILDVTAEVTRQRNAYFITFNIREGQSFDFGEITVVSDLAEVDPDEFLGASRIRSGSTYTPVAVENTIARMERLALQKGMNFIRVEPRVIRNDAEQTLDIEFAVVKGPRVFVERIDIEGNNTTLDKVIRREFKSVEGDPFNPREIRQAAERIRALGYFKTAEVDSREGSAPGQVVVDVNVEEAPTGSLGFGASYSSSGGLGLNVSFSESNFLGRGQTVGLSFDTSIDNRKLSASFLEPSFLDRNLQFGLSAAYQETDNDAVSYDTKLMSFSPSLVFPLSENGRLQLSYTLRNNEISDVSADSSAILHAEAGSKVTSEIGYTYSYDTRRTGLNPNAGILFQFSQSVAGLGGDNEYLKSTARLLAQKKIAREEVTISAEFQAGALNMFSGNSRVTDRFLLSSDQLRGFEPFSIGPTDLAAANADRLGGNYFAVARFEARFPVGLPEEYGIDGGLFFDIGSVWGLDNTAGGPFGGPITAVDDGLKIRSSIGFSIFWDTALGPLRLNFGRALQKESYDETRVFDLTISTQF